MPHLRYLRSSRITYLLILGWFLKWSHANRRARRAGGRFDGLSKWPTDLSESIRR
jgi:hypothetical protein